MSARTFRLLIQNNTALDFTLQEQHLCGGDWTPDWTPASTIAAKGEAGLQSESSGIMTGTEGWVKYAITDVVNNTTEQLYLHWSNPYYDAPTFPSQAGDNPSAQVSVTDVTPHCDAGTSGGGGGFTGVPQHSVVLVFASSNPGDPSLGDYVLAYSNPASIIAGFLHGFQSSLYAIVMVRESDSVRQSLPRSYDPGLGLRALTSRANTTSVRTLLAL
jgi:hypothetical protein